MSASASGASASNGSARNRDHNQGNQERKYTAEQKAAVLRIRACQATAFYEILAIEKTCSDAEVKKAYRKQSLLTHPDKNGHPHADEAFKMVQGHSVSWEIRTRGTNSIGLEQTPIVGSRVLGNNRTHSREEDLAVAVDEGEEGGNRR